MGTTRFHRDLQSRRANEFFLGRIHREDHFSLPHLLNLGAAERSNHPEIAPDMGSDSRRGRGRIARTM